MRRESTAAEKTLWSRLGADQLEGLRFRRQYRMGAFIVDFYCSALRLVIEIDGESHDDREEADSEREHYLASRGAFVLRFLNEDVLKSTDAVLEEILRTIERIQKTKNPLPCPLPEYRERE